MIRLYIFIKSLIIKSLIIIKLDELPAPRALPAACCFTRSLLPYTSAGLYTLRRNLTLAHNNKSSRCPS